MTSAQKVIVVSNPLQVLVLVEEDGTIVKATCPDYVGMGVSDARLAAISVMRYWDPTIQDNGYPDVTEAA